ncbi:MAG: deoxyribose-phosphate aldolase [Caldilineaceae bacterium]|nr:deoxyribose-phosphate aldolase [Caldilineaceae bacterium]
MSEQTHPPITAEGVASTIDHTALKPETDEAAIRKLCAEARDYGFASVCLNPTWVALAADLLAGTPIKVCTVIGFPLGATLTSVKAYETAETIRAGAQEVDMVINIGWLKGGRHVDVEADIAAVVAAARRTAQESGLPPVLVKVIIETALLTDVEKRKACELVVAAGADFVKTSTGFSGGGATVDDVTLMREIVGRSMGVKAAGGIRTAADALAMLAAGATRLGASAGVQIMQSMAGSGGAPDKDAGGAY